MVQVRVDAVVLLVDDEGRRVALGEAQQPLLELLDGVGVDVGFVVPVDQDVPLLIQYVNCRNRHF